MWPGTGKQRAGGAARPRAWPWPWAGWWISTIPWTDFYIFLFIRLCEHHRTRPPGESRGPCLQGLRWIPAFAGMTGGHSAGVTESSAHVTPTHSSPRGRPHSSPRRAPPRVTPAKGCQPAPESILQLCLIQIKNISYSPGQAGFNRMNPYFYRERLINGLFIP